MDSMMRSRFDMAAAWSGLIGLAIFMIGWAGFAGFMTPIHSPSAGPEEIAAIFRANPTSIRIGMVLAMVGALFTIPFSAIIVKKIAQIEGGFGILSLAALLGGISNMILTFYPGMWWLLAAFRPERNPELIQLINDAAWLQIIGGITIFLAMPLAMAVVAFCDRSDNPTFPRWSAYVNLWLVLLLLPDQLIFFFHRGIFAWDGLFGFYIPLTAFGAWYIVAFVLLRRSIMRDRAADQSRDSESVPVAQPVAG